MSITYDSVPSAPVDRSVSSCYLVCSGTIITPDSTPTLTGKATDDDGGNLRMDYEVYSGFSSSPATRVSAGSTTVREGTLSSWTTGRLATGNYEYRVRAWDGTTYGPWSSGWIQFSVDTTRPSAPDVSISGATTTSETKVVGTVGAAVTANFTTSHNSGTVEVVYSVYDNLPTYTSQHAPACTSSAGGVVVLCRKAGGTYPTQTIAGVDDSTRLYAVAFDAAGNVSSTASLKYYVNPDVAGVQAGHAWFFQAADAATNATGTTTTQVAPIPDTASKSPVALNAGAGVTFGPGSPNSAMTHADPVTGVSDPLVMTVSNFDGTGAASTTAKVIDTTKSFSVGAWVRPTKSSASATFPIVTQVGKNESMFFLQDGGSRWRMCIPTSDATTYSGNCADSVAVPVVNSWTFVVGVWDAINHQIRLYVTPAGPSAGGDPTVTSTYHASAPASVGGLYVGQDKIGAQVRHFTGSIFEPMAFQAVLTPGQISQLMQYEVPALT